eukprot:gene3409-6770_t
MLFISSLRAKNIAIGLAHDFPKRLKATIAVAMSGGIDSSVSALLLQEQGYDVVGVYMRNWDAADEAGAGAKTCTSEADYQDVKQVCEHLRIPHTKVDFVKEYWNDVFVPFLASYESGTETPNPDVACNRFIKFKSFQDHISGALGVDAMATGHYARLCQHQDRDSPDMDTGSGDWTARDRFKDQTYFLSMTVGDRLRRVQFPVGHLTKTQVRDIASRRLAGLRVLDRKESMGICFVGKRDIFIDIDSGTVVGSHRGAEMLTIGQGARISGCTMPYYIVGRESSSSSSYSSSSNLSHSGDVWVCLGNGHPALYADTLTVAITSSSSLTNRDGDGGGGGGSSFNWIAGRPPRTLLQQLGGGSSGGGGGGGILRCRARTRHGLPLEPCEVRIVREAAYVSSVPAVSSRNSSLLDNRSNRSTSTSTATELFNTDPTETEASSGLLSIRFLRPQRALTVGQVVALYATTSEGDPETTATETDADAKGLICLGGGPIATTGPSLWRQGLSMH